MSRGSNSVEEKPTKPVAKKGKVEVADSFLGVVSKLVTVVAAISTVSFWAYSNYYVGTLEIQPDVPVDAVTLNVYNEKGDEQTFHTTRVQMTPGRYQVVVTAEPSDNSSPDAKSSSRRYTVNVALSKTTTVSHKVIAEKAADESTDDKAETKSNHRWWQFWR